MQLHTIHALRFGLCFKVHRGDLTLRQATDIFEGARSSLIEAWSEQKRLRNLEKKNKLNKQS